MSHERRSLTRALVCGLGALSWAACQPPQPSEDPAAAGYRPPILLGVPTTSAPNPPGHRPDPTKPEGTDLIPNIEHIVVLMMENHSYDNYFGMLDRGDGLPRDKDGNRKVRLFTFRGKQLAETSVGVNVEMGFSPDGRALVNFDLSDKTDDRSGIWTLPRLKRAPAPAWAIEGETTFVQGTRFVKRYAENSLSVVRWPDGRRLHTVAAGQNARLRALSGNGRYGLLHQRQEQPESLDWIDFATGRRLTIASGPHGGIDHATIDATGRSFAWTERSAGSDNRVTVRKASIDVEGTPVIRPANPLDAIGEKPASAVSQP